MENTIADFILTVVVEAILFAIFGLAGKENWQHFGIINIVTRVMLNAYLLYTVKDDTISMGVFIGLIVAELIICIIEAVYYLTSLKFTDGKSHRRRCIIYSAIANAASFLLGLWVFQNMWIGLF
ncbi:MAG: hypothetical protein IKW95_05060 [Lachnospiraceae bacterium]|nr:hypothetical protein [Lachnospiraceae bacterium]